MYMIAVIYRDVDSVINFDHLLRNIKLTMTHDNVKLLSYWLNQDRWKSISKLLSCCMTCRETRLDGRMSESFPTFELLEAEKEMRG